MSWTYLLICLPLLQCSSTANIDEYKSYKNYKVYEIKGSNQKIHELVHYLTKNYEVPSHAIGAGVGHMLVAPHLGPLLEDVALSKHLNAKNLIDDYSKIIEMEKANPRKGLGYSWTAYHDINEINEYLHNMSKSYPDSTQVIVGGKSYEGRQILGVRINTPSSKKKPVIFIESGIHAREWIAPATTTYFINQLLTSKNKNITNLRDDYDWHIFPSVNPDGYHYSFTVDRMWRKTRSKQPNSDYYGADPNRNWDYNWCDQGGSKNPSDEIYCGTKAFSEIETKSLSEYISSLQNLRGYISFHSFAQMLLLPYSDSTDHVDNYDELKKIGQVSLDYGKRVNNEVYGGPGTAAEILYKVSGGSMDWVRYVHKTRLVYTYELRGFGFIWPPEKIYEQGDEVTQMLLGMATAARKMGPYHDTTSAINKYKELIEARIKWN